MSIEFLVEFTRYTEQRNMPITIGLGNSILKIAKDKLTAVKPEFNFCSEDIVGTVDTLYSSLKLCNVKNIVVGCPIHKGEENPQQTIDNALDVLGKLRMMFPLSRIIVYDLLPITDLWMFVNTWSFETGLSAWVKNDVDSVFIPLYKNFGGFLGLFPAIKRTDTGILISDKGVFEFNELLERAKRVRAASIVT